MTLEPYANNVLVELLDEYTGIVMPDKKYDTKTSGKVIKSPVDELLNKTIYFEEYKDSTRVNYNGKNYAFINIKDIKGYNA